GPSIRPAHLHDRVLVTDRMVARTAPGEFAVRLLGVRDVPDGLDERPELPASDLGGAQADRPVDRSLMAESHPGPPRNQHQPDPQLIGDDDPLTQVIRPLTLELPRLLR